ncbi:MAG: asparagine synthase C-terminal domain-containing protein [Bacteroidales bacterium]|nr:asparagine synthase C-terminal domain-containing protein [Bacteroidales bacterium]
MQNKVNIKIILEDCRGFPWYGDDQCRVHGSFFDSDGKYYSGNAMSGYFAAAGTYEAFRTLAAQVNGVFSVVRMNAGECWLATDLVRSLPLFYCRSGTDWVVSDHADLLMEYLDEAAFNETARLEFRGTGYVTGSETLVKGIQQLQAGEVLRLGEKADHGFYHTYRTAAGMEISYGQLLKQAEAEMEQTFSRMVQSLEGRAAVVPLSGGFDSRLIAVMLKRHRHRKVVCFTYGRKGNEEAAISERVARELGFPWHFVEYNEQLIAEFIRDPEFNAFYPRASNLTSMFFLQEYFAVKCLRDQGTIPGDAVFIPGHSGDFLGGSQFAKHRLPVEQEAVSTLARRILEVKYHFERYNKSERSLMLKRITDHLLQKQVPGQRLLPGRITDQLQQKQVSGLDSATARSWSVHEDWDLKEKLAKFNVNSNATYTFFGYAFRLPYYDRELVNFFRDVPVAVKRGKSLYDDLLVNEYFIPEGVHFDVELQTPDRAYAMARFRGRIKRLLPQWVLALRRRKSDVLFYREITSQLRQDLVDRGGRPAAYGSRYNKMIIDWYLSTLHEKISK